MTQTGSCPFRARAMFAILAGRCYSSKRAPLPWRGAERLPPLVEVRNEEVSCVGLRGLTPPGSPGRTLFRSFACRLEKHWPFDLPQVHRKVHVPATPVAGDDPDRLRHIPRAPHVCNFGGRVLFFDRAPLPWRDRTLGPVMRRPAGVDPPWFTGAHPLILRPRTEERRAREKPNTAG